MWVLLSVLLLPIIPAAMLFALIPKGGSNGFISGKIDGHQYKFGGAFAGYIAVLIFTTKFLLPQVWVHATDQAWEIRGSVDKNDPTFDPKKIHFIVDPPGSPANAAGEFIVTFKPAGGILTDLPCLQLEMPDGSGVGHVTAILQAGEQNLAPTMLAKVVPVEVDTQLHRIRLKQTIPLDRLPAGYEPVAATTGAPPPKAPAGGAQASYGGEQ
jgi:hypothetical protein